MEQALSDLVTLIGVDLQTLATLSGILYLGVEWIKRRFPIQGVGTEILVGLLALGLAFSQTAPLETGSWTQFGALGVILFIAPAGFHSFRKNGKS